MKPFKLVVNALFACLIILTPVYSQTPNEPEALTTLFEVGPEELSYTGQFEAAVSTAQLRQIIDQIVSQVGSFIKVKGDKNPYTLIFEKGTARVHMVLDEQGRVAGLQFTEVIPASGSLEQAVDRITSLDAKTSVLIRRNGDTLIAKNEKEPLAVASAFKLAVLAALEDAVREGRLAWDQSIGLKPEWKSLPTGILQDWPDYTKLTVETLAVLMISKSDNTATDALISLIGRREVEAYLPHSRPVLTTAEAFRLKNGENSDLLKEFREGSIENKRRVLEKLSGRPLPKPELFTGNPVAPDIEWFMSTEELADLLERLQSYDLLTINPGLAAKTAWRRVAYKGGSEPGIINLSTLLIGPEGEKFTVSVTVNRQEAALNETEVFVAYQGILNALQ